MSSPTLPVQTDCRTVRAKMQDGGKFLLIDCREKNEYDLVRIDGALLLPMSDITQRLSDLAAYQDHAIAVHCHHGGRSLRVTQWLRQNGFPQAQNMAGGIDAWALEIEPGMARY